MLVNVNDANFDPYDVVVVGSGPAGATLALRLGEAGKRVLVVETGGLEFDSDVQDQFATMLGEGHFNGAHWAGHWTRTLGGTSTVWAGWCATLDARDFALWPISDRDLAAHYVAAARVLGRSQTTLGYRAAFLPGFAFKPFSSEPPLQFGPAFADTYRASRAVDVLLNTTLRQIRPNAGRTLVEGISLFTTSGQIMDVTLRPHQNLVLAGGGMGNAQMMLAPTHNSEIGVGNENDMVGRCLMEHPHFYGVGRAILAPGFAPPTAPAAFGAHIAAVIPADDVYRDIGGIGVTIEFENGQINPDDRIESVLADRLGRGAAAYSLTVRSEMKPVGENRVVLTSARDPSGLPRVQATCVISSDDLRSVHNCLQILGRAIASRNIGRVHINNDVLYRGVLGGGHTMGTTRMGADPRQSVVDRDCRVHGYSNYYAVGSSVFTTGGASNPTLTIVALAARLADHLRGAA